MFEGFFEKKCSKINTGYWFYKEGSTKEVCNWNIYDFFNQHR